MWIHLQRLLERLDGPAVIHAVDPRAAGLKVRLLFFGWLTGAHRETPRHRHDQQPDGGVAAKTKRTHGRILREAPPACNPLLHRPFLRRVLRLASLRNSAHD